MAKIRIVGDSSGYVEIAAPSAAGNNTLELPSGNTRLVGSDSAGNVSISGIVTAATFSGNVNSTGISTFTSGIVVSAGSTSAPSISPSGDSNTGIFFPSADTIAFGEGGVESARFDSSGRLGIGTINPTSLLHLSSTTTPQLNVQAPTGESQIRISSGTGNYRRILFVDSATTPTKNNFEIAVQEVDNSLFFGPSTTVGGLTFSGSTGLRVDSSGRVTMPSQPAFLAFFSSSSDATTNSGAVFAFNRTDYNIGSHFDTSTNVGRFTAPVAGIYAFSWAMFFTNSGGNTQGMNVAFLKNGSQYTASSGGTTSDAFQISNTPNSTGGTLSNSATYYFNLSANDYIELYARGANARLYQGHSHFCGYLIG
jgi:hypothetical protein